MCGAIHPRGYRLNQDQDQKVIWASTSTSSDMTAVDMAERLERGLVVSICGQQYFVVTVFTDPTIRPPGFDLPRRSWSLLKRFQTGQTR